MHAEVLLVVACAALLVAACLVLLPRRRDSLSSLIWLISHLEPGRIEKIADLAEVDDAFYERKMWEDSGKLRGLNRRLADLALLILVMQIIVATRPELRARTGEVWHLALGQVWFSLLAYPEALVCSLWPDVPHTTARIAAGRHVALTFAIQNLFFMDDTPECIGNLF